MIEELEIENEFDVADDLPIYEHIEWSELESTELEENEFIPELESSTEDFYDEYHSLDFGE